MSSGPLLTVESPYLEFKFVLHKQISCTLYLWNKSDDFVAFKVKTTNPKKYSVRPNIGIVPPRSSFEVFVTMQAQQEKPADMQCKDKFLLQSSLTRHGATVKDITPDMFIKESGRHVEETKLKVVYVTSAQQPSPVVEEAVADVSRAVSVADNGNDNLTESITASRAPDKPQDDDLAEARAQQISKLSNEKLDIFEKNDYLRREMDLLRRGISGRGGFSFLVVVIVGLLGMLMGYVLKKN